MQISKILSLFLRYLTIFPFILLINRCFTTPLKKEENKKMAKKCGDYLFCYHFFVPLSNKNKKQ